MHYSVVQPQGLYFANIKTLKMKSKLKIRHLTSQWMAVHSCLKNCKLTNEPLLDKSISLDFSLGICSVCHYEKHAHEIYSDCKNDKFSVEMF